MLIAAREYFAYQLSTYATMEVPRPGFTIKTLLLSGVTELVSIGNIS